MVDLTIILSFIGIMGILLIGSCIIIKKLER